MKKRGKQVINRGGEKAFRNKVAELEKESRKGRRKKEGHTRGREKNREMHVHSNPSNSISSIPEAHIARVGPARGRIPRHDNQIEVNDNVQNGEPVPGAKFGARQAEPLAPIADDVEAYAHQKIKDGVGENLEGCDKIEGVSGGRGDDH